MNDSSFIDVIYSMNKFDVFSNADKLKKGFKKVNTPFNRKALKDNEVIIAYLLTNYFNEECCYIAIDSLLSTSRIDAKNFILKDALSNINTNYSEDFLEELMIDLYRKGCNFEQSLINYEKVNETIDKKSSKRLQNAMERFNYYVIYGKRMEKEIEPQSFEEIVEEDNNFIRESDIKKIEKYGRLLNMKEYKETPTIGREKELKSLIITLAQDKTCPIIVGESGVGKTALVDELSYRIQNGDVPDFLKNQLILEVSPSEVVSGCKYVGMFEQNMKELLDICKKYNILLFIDEIHEMYGTGSGEKKETDMADIIKRYISRDNGRIIGTTTKEEYLEHFSNDALKRRFDKIEVEEPTKVVLYQIVEKVIEDFSNKNNIYFETEEEREEVIKVIVESTSKLKPYNDKLCNPDLSIKLIDKAYAYAKIENRKFISKDNFISSFEDTKWLYDSTIKSAINRLKNINSNEIKEQKCLILDFNNYLK